MVRRPFSGMRLSGRTSDTLSVGSAFLAIDRSAFVAAAMSPDTRAATMTEPTLLRLSGKYAPAVFGAGSTAIPRSRTTPTISTHGGTLPSGRALAAGSGWPPPDAHV